MSAEIHYPGGTPTPIGQFLRVGHRQLETFHNTERIQLPHVIDAAQKATNRLDRMRGVLEDLDHTLGSESTRSASLKTRSSVQAKFKPKTR